MTPLPTPTPGLRRRQSGWSGSSRRSGSWSGGRRFTPGPVVREMAER